MAQESRMFLVPTEPRLEDDESVFQKFESPAGCIATFFGFFLVVCGMFGLSAVGYYDTIPSSMIRIRFFQFIVRLEPAHGLETRSGQKFARLWHVFKMKNSYNVQNTFMEF